MSMIRVQDSRLGSLLKTARRAARLSQETLAANAGVHRNAVVSIEAGRGHVDTLLALAAALGMELVGRALAGQGPIGERLQALRKRRRLSRGVVAAMAGLSIPAVASIEATSSGHVASLEALGRAIGAGLRLIPVGTALGFWDGAATTSAGEEWYTPGWLIERVVAVVGPIDLDPCSPGRSKSAVKARLHLTATDDGLSHPWVGTTWLNPPYGAGIGQWMQKVRHEVAVGNAKKVLALVPARTDTRWWHDNVAGAADVLMLKGRISFIGGDGPAPFPSALLGYGLTLAERHALFSAFPDAWHIPCAEPVAAE